MEKQPLMVYFCGDYESKVYVYKPSVVRDLKDGGTIPVEVAPYDTTLVSDSTGTEFDTAGACSALMRNGIVFGGTSSALEPLKYAAAASDGPFYIIVKRDGNYSPGIPNLVAMTCHPFEIEQRIDELGISRGMSMLKSPPVDVVEGGDDSTKQDDGTIGGCFTCFVVLAIFLALCFMIVYGCVSLI